MEAAPRESGGVLGGVFVLGEGSGWLLGGGVEGVPGGVEGGASETVSEGASEGSMPQARSMWCRLSSIVS